MPDNGWLLALFFVGVVAPVEMLAQEATSVPIRGRVVDAATGRPVLGAVVTHLGTSQVDVTDSLGTFLLTVPAAEAYPLRIEQFGYEPSQALLGSTAPSDFTTVSLRSKPLELEGLSVTVDRFARRRHFAFQPVEVLDAASLMQARGSAWDVVRKAVPGSRMCTSDLNHLCFFRRRRWRRIRVCIDEMRAYGGAADLLRYAPWELYMVEVYDGGVQVRVYTRWFVEKLMGEGSRLRPLSWGCS